MTSQELGVRDKLFSQSPHGSLGLTVVLRSRGAAALARVSGADIEHGTGVTGDV